VTLLRGKKQGLEIVLSGPALDDALDELAARLAERPDFYRGIAATANFGDQVPSDAQIARLRALLDQAGMPLRCFAGCAEVAELAARYGLEFENVATTALERRRALRPRGPLELSDAARSLVADFAGARADIAQRRKRGEASVPRVQVPAPEPPPVANEAPALHVVEAPPGTLYHTGTLRGGQALAHVGNIVVVGDVNPGAELIATGEILVFGRLAGVAHAGAQGDESAKVYALDLDATQLRIATFIAADGERTPRPGGPEVALVRDGRIVVMPFDRIGQLDQRGASFV